MDFGAKVEKLEKQSFLGVLRQNWSFLKLIKYTWDDTPKSGIYDQNPLSHIENLIYNPNLPFFGGKNPAKTQETCFKLFG